MSHGYKGVGFAAAKVCIKPKNGRGLITASFQTQADIAQKVAQAPGGVGVGKEQRRILVFPGRTAPQDLCEICRKVRFGYTAEHILAGCADVEE